MFPVVLKDSEKSDRVIFANKNGNVSIYIIGARNGSKQLLVTN